MLWKEACDLLCHHHATTKIRTVTKPTIFSRFWSQLIDHVLFWRAAASACAWGGVTAEMHNEDSGDTRTIFGLLQSWRDLEPAQCSTHRCYLVEGLSKHTAVTSKRFVFPVAVCWLKPKLSHRHCCCLRSQAQVSKGVLQHVTTTTAFGWAAVSLLWFTCGDLKLWECAIFSTGGGWSPCQIL